MKLRSSVFGGAAAALLVAAGSAQAFVTDPHVTGVYFDQISNIVTVNGVSTVSAPIAGQGNLQTGMAVNLANWTNNVSQAIWLDTLVVNTSGAAITAKPIRLNVWIWQSVAAASINTANPVFSNQLDLGLGLAAPTATFTFGPSSLASNTVSNVTLNFGQLFTMNLTTASQMGISFNWQVDNGAGFVNLVGLNTGVTGGATTPAPAVGTNIQVAPNAGYFRSANNADINGQFLGSSARNIGANSAVPFALYVPAPSAAMSIGGLGLLAARRRRR